MEMRLHGSSVCLNNIVRAFFWIRCSANVTSISEKKKSGTLLKINNYSFEFKIKSIGKIFSIHCVF